MRCLGERPADSIARGGLRSDIMKKETVMSAVVVVGPQEYRSVFSSRRYFLAKKATNSVRARARVMFILLHVASLHTTGIPLNRLVVESWSCYLCACSPPPPPPLPVT